MKFRFRPTEDPVFSDDPYYDLFDGGYISPLDLLEDEAQAEEVLNAVAVIREYLDEAASSGAVVIC